ncbi:hypothetical protein QBC39DRAFT_405217 [Podospora conica]|nr:hypothetical protein QBC39DRAFT_405217 [Schizothecium conicum]
MFTPFPTTSPFPPPLSPLYPLAPPSPRSLRRLRDRTPHPRAREPIPDPPTSYFSPPALDTPALPHRELFAGVYDAYDNRGKGLPEGEPEAEGGSRAWVDGKGEEKGFWAFVKVEGVEEGVLRAVVEGLRAEKGPPPLPKWAVKKGLEYGSTAADERVDVADDGLLRAKFFRDVADPKPEWPTLDDEDEHEVEKLLEYSRRMKETFRELRGQQARARALARFKPPSPRMTKEEGEAMLAGWPKLRDELFADMKLEDSDTEPSQDIYSPRESSQETYSSQDSNPEASQENDTSQDSGREASQETNPSPKSSFSLP